MKNTAKKILLVFLATVSALALISFLPYLIKTGRMEQAKTVLGETVEHTIAGLDAPKKPGAGAVPEGPAELSGYGGLEIHFIDVGQGDCTLIGCDGSWMLIDAGDYTLDSLVPDYVKKRTHTLDYVIATHPDRDHVSGLSNLFSDSDITIKKSFASPYDRDDTATMYYVHEAMDKAGVKEEVPPTGDTYELGGSSFTFLAPDAFHESCNDNSLCFILTYGDTRFLFTGDAEEEEEKELAGSGYDLSCNVLKIGHHGSKTSTSDELLSAASPEFAVISVGEGNDYYHPHARTLNALRMRGIQVFRTDEQGSIICYSDGKKITFNAAPSTSWKSGS